MPSYPTLDPKLDVVFKMLFGRPQNRELLVSLLEAVLDLPTAIRSVQVESDLGKEAVDDKGIALDVRVELEDGQQVDVEMQSQPRLSRRERGLYYWARMYGGQLRRGEGYDELCRCVVIQILDFRELETARFHSIFRVIEIHDHEEFSDQLELELPKLGAESLQNGEPALARWGKFLRASSDEEREALAMTDPILRKAKDALEDLSADPEARVLAEMRDMALKSYQLEMGTARRVGRAEGRVEGRAEALALVLLRLLDAKFGTVPEPIAVRVRSAVEAELLRWSEKVLSAESIDAVFGD